MQIKRLLEWRGAISVLLALLMLLAACSGRGGGVFDVISLAEFPDGPGRGFPTAQAPDANAALAVGEPAPDFSFVLDSGEGASLSDLRGRPVVINFWASWCGPCRAEMPELVALHESRADLVVLAVNVQEGLAPIEEFADEFGMTMPVVRDDEGAINRAYGVRGLPATIFVDAEGRVASRWDGVLDEALLLQRVAELDARGE